MLLCSIFMIVTNNIKMTKATQCASVHDESSCFFWLFAGHSLKLLAESRWNQSGVTALAKYQIWAEVCLVWIRDEHNMDRRRQGAKWKEKELRAVQQYFSPDGITEQKGLSSYTYFCCHISVKKSQCVTRIQRWTHLSLLNSCLFYVFLVSRAWVFFPFLSTIKSFSKNWKQFNIHSETYISCVYSDVTIKHDDLTVDSPCSL